MARGSIAHRRGAARTLVLLLAATSAGLLAAPAARATPGDTLRVTPGQGLVSGQWVTASWSGVAPGDAVYLRQCTLNPVSIHDCAYLGPHALHNGGIAPASGDGSLIFPVAGVLNGSNPTDRFTCDDAHACSVALFTDPTATDLGQAVFDPVDFAVSADTCPAPLSTDVVVNGQGTYTASRAFRAWEGRLCRSPHDLHVGYRGTTSRQGEAAFVAGRASFAMTTEPLGAADVATLARAHRRFAYAPLVGSGLAFGFRMVDAATGEAITTLNLTPEQLARIFTGQLTDLNDDADVLAQNPGVTFPPVLLPIGRSDATPQTRLLTSWFLAVARRAYRDGGVAFRGKATDTFPNTGAIRLVAGERAVATAVGAPRLPDPTQFGTIGWIDSSVAAMWDLPTVRVENASGSFVAPTTPSIASGIRAMTTNPDGVTRSPRFLTHDANAYPLPTVTYLVEQTSVTKEFDGTEAAVLRAFVRGVASNVRANQGHAPLGGKLPDGYAPLPSPMIADAEHAADQLPTATYTAPTPSPTPGGGTGFGGGGTGGFGGPGGGSGGTGTPPFGSSGSGSGTTSPTPTVVTGPSAAALPPYSLTSSSGGYVWPVVLIGGLALLVLGTMLSLALGLASRHGAKKALASAAAERGAPTPPAADR